jgi:dTDP-4-dehydrorhamnose 3,5-epimerase
MNLETLDVPGAWLLSSRQFEDDRGWFQEWFKHSIFMDQIGYNFVPVQANISHSSAGSIRGIHYSTAPEGQGKLVTVMNGEIDDYAIDLNPASSTFGKWTRVRLSADNRQSLLLSPYMGHAFQALVPNTVVSYLVTAEFNPVAEKGIMPFCRTIDIQWATNLAPLVSPKDIDAPDLTTQQNAGNLPVSP